MDQYQQKKIFKTNLLFFFSFYFSYCSSLIIWWFCFGFVYLFAFFDNSNTFRKEKLNIYIYIYIWDGRICAGNMVSFLAGKIETVQGNFCDCDLHAGTGWWKNNVYVMQNFPDIFTEKSEKQKLHHSYNP